MFSGFINTVQERLSEWWAEEEGEKEKKPGYIINMISNCPDYISTPDVYKPDEWELPR